MSTPDITKAQVVAVAKFAVTAAVALSLPIDQHLREEIIGGASLLAPAIVFADVLLRRKRVDLALMQLRSEIEARMHKAYMEQQAKPAGPSDGNG